jgi:hypothetical protein
MRLTAPAVSPNLLFSLWEYLRLDLEEICATKSF